MRASVLVVLLGCTTRPARTVEPPQPPGSPEPTPCETAAVPATSGPPELDAFVAAYVAAAPEARAGLADGFVAGRRFPIIGDDGTVAFVYAGTAHDVRVIGDFRAQTFYRVDWDPQGQPLAPIVDGGTMWVARMRLQPDARLDYQIAVDGKAGPDPLNPHAIESGIAGHASELAMPQAAAAPLRDDVPHGTLAVVGEAWAKPKITVYLPPGYDPTRRYPALYTADGAAWIELVHLPQLLDDRIARGTITPVIAVMIDAAEDRSAWYTWNPDYLAYLDRAVAYVDAHYATRADPAHRVHAGTSAGGRASLQVALERPSTFGNVAMMSPSLVGYPHVFEPYFSGRLKPSPLLRVWLSAGRYEGTICEDTRTMARWLHGAGIATNVSYSREGHSFGAWRHVAADMVAYFFAR